MIEDSNITELIDNYITQKYKFINSKREMKIKQFYLKFYEFLTIKQAKSITTFNFKNYENLVKIDDDNKKYKLKKGEFNLRTEELRNRFKGTISTKFINNNNLHKNLKNKNVRIIDIAKKDFLELKILELVRKKQKIEENNYIPAVYILDSTVEDMNAGNLFDSNPCILSFSFDFEKIKGNFTFDNNDLSIVLENKTIKRHKKIYNYYKLRKLAENGFEFLKTEPITGRKHHSISQISGEFRAIIRTSNNIKMMSYDIKTSHPFFLSIITKNELLYNEVKNGNIKSLEKTTLLSWLNSKNHKSNNYKKINNFMDNLDVNHLSYRNKNGILYYNLAKMEADYVLGIADELTKKGIENYTVHDQIYFDINHENNFKNEVKKANKNLLFEPIWVKNK